MLSKWEPYHRETSSCLNRGVYLYIISIIIFNYMKNFSKIKSKFVGAAQIYLIVYRATVYVFLCSLKDIIAIFPTAFTENSTFKA